MNKEQFVNPVIPPPPSIFNILHLGLVLLFVLNLPRISNDIDWGIIMKLIQKEILSQSDILQCLVKFYSQTRVGVRFDT